MTVRSLRESLVHYATRHFDPRVYVIGYSLLAALLVGALLWIIGDRHDQAATSRRLCAAELAVVKARNPYLDRMVMPADPCVAIRMVSR